MAKIKYPIGTTRTCRDCGRLYVVTERHKRFHWGNFCITCHRRRKAEYMKLWKRKRYHDPNDQFREMELRRQSNYRKRHIQRLRERDRKRNQDLKVKVLSHYSSEIKCAKCGFSDIRALTIDHIGGGGTKHRKEVGLGKNFYHWLVRNHFPDGYQVLCANCQRIKLYEKGEALRGRLA